MGRFQVKRLIFYSKKVIFLHFIHNENQTCFLFFPPTMLDYGMLVIYTI